MRPYAIAALTACLVLLGACGRQENLEVEHFVEETAPTGTVAIDPGAELAFGKHNVIDGLIDLSLVLNTASHIWNIVQSNRAATNVTSQYANALPGGARSGVDLSGFSDLNRRSFRSYGKNKFGVTVYDVQYTVVHRNGGTYNGQGKYLDQVSVIPTYVNALWGYTVDLSVTASPPTNVGTQDAPVADLLMDLSIRVSTVINSATTRKVFEFRGDDSVAQEILNGGSRGAVSPVHLAAN